MNINNKIINLWYGLNEKIRFLLVGGFNFSVAYVIYSLSCVILGTNLYQIALIIAWVISSIISFFTQKIFVFRNKDKWVKQYFKCCITWTFSYIINAVILDILVKHILNNVFIAQIIAALTAAVFTYISFKIYAFKNK